MSTSLTTISARVREVLADQAARPVEEITDDKTLAQDLSLDSLDRVELSLAFEDEFGIDDPYGDIEGLKTVGDVMALIAGKLRGGAA